MNEDRLRAAYAAAVERGTVKSATTHPSPEALAALVRREGPESERLATLDHVMSCKECRAEFDLLRAVERAGTEAGAGRSGARRTWLVPAALAATLVLAVGIGRLMEKHDGDVTRGGETGGPVLLRPAAQAPAGSALTFAWSAAPGARKYSLEVLDAGGGVVASAETADTTATPSAATSLPPGDYTWWVRVTTTDARTLGSAVRPLRLTAK